MAEHALITAPTRRNLFGQLAAGAAIAAGGIPPAIAAPPDADAPILAACADFMRLDRIYKRICNEEGGDPTLAFDASYSAAMATVTDLRATTLQGQRAKAAAVIAYHEPKFPADYPSEQLIWSLVEDVAGGPRTIGLDEVRVEREPVLWANPDEELIRISAEHIVNLRTFNASGEWLDDGPLWRGYRDTYEALDKGEPQTFAGLVALAQASAAEHAVDGGDNREWASAVVNGLIRLAGCAA